LEPSPHRNAIVVMARYPTPGRVKTRLARSLGDEAACRLYTAFLADIGARFGARPDIDLVWAFEPSAADFAAVVGPHSRCVAQVGSDLGERMCNAFRQLLSHGYRRVVMIGADVPHVGDDVIAGALHRIERADVALGPSEDGGYYLIAMKRPHDVFATIPMGTPRVFEETLARARALHLAIELLPTLFDVDEVEDLRRLRDVVAQPVWEQRLPHTAHFLATSSI